ncbi:MAG TPA: hypothetical protein VGC80_18405, partial [Acetobacteraceae bacterium]
MSRAVVALSFLSLASCSQAIKEGPVAWWHNLEGGRIAEERPPPPRDDAPYPHLSGVPARPQATNAANRARIAASLLSDRANAQHAATVQPLAPVRAAVPRPEAPPPPPSSEGANASLEAASAPPAPPAPTPSAPAPAPMMAAPRPVQSAAPPAPVPAADLPGMGSRAPPPPVLPGVPGYTVPVAAPVAPP